MPTTGSPPPFLSPSPQNAKQAAASPSLIKVVRLIPIGRVWGLLHFLESHPQHAGIVMNLCMYVHKRDRVREQFILLRHYKEEERYVFRQGTEIIKCNANRQRAPVS